MARVAGARGRRGGWGWTGRFSHRRAPAAFWAKRRRADLILPSVRVCAIGIPIYEQKSSPGSLTFLPRATFTYCVNVVAAPCDPADTTYCRVAGG